MKKTNLLFVMALLCHPLFAQMTTAQWREDLHHLSQTVHQKYPNLFHQVTAAQFDAEVTRLDQRLPQLKDYEIVAELSRLVAMFRIGHTQLSLIPAHGNSTPPGLSYGRVPVLFYLFSDGLYIRAADKKYQHTVGGKVLKIGKLSTEQALEAIRPYTVYENEKGFESAAPFYLTIPELTKTAGISESMDQLEVFFSKNGKEERVVFEKMPFDVAVFSTTGLTLPSGYVDAAEGAKVPLWRREPTQYRYMEYLKDSKTLYLRHSVTLNDGDKTIDAFFKNALDFIDKNDVEKLILDVRMNGGGNNYLNKPIITSIIAARKINQHGKFFCIIGRRTFSACQNLVNELSKYTEVTFVGEPTAENINFYGDTRTETLPNSQLSLQLSWMWWQNLDPRDKRPWMPPHLAANMSFEDYRNGKDPALDVIAAYGSDAPDTETQLCNLVTQNKYDEAVMTGKKYLNNPVYSYSKDDLEAKINAYGYQLIAAGTLETANKVFKLNVDLFPESANVYDSYAESWMRLGKTTEAIRNYETAISKDEPNGVTAENARNMIQRIKGN